MNKMLYGPDNELHDRLVPYVGTIHSLVMILLAFDIQEFRISVEQVGDIFIETEKSLSAEVIGWLEQYRPIGAEFHFKYGAMGCHCFGPPAKDCPIHGVN